MTAARITGASASVLLHAALLVALTMTLPSAQPPAGVSIPPKADEGEVDMHLIPQVEGDGSGLSCEHSYHGIGVVLAFGSTVSEVVPGGPADTAGLRVGDELLNGEIFVRDAYAIGREFSLRITRRGDRMDLPVRIGKVCYDSPSSIPHLREAP